MTRRATVLLLAAVALLGAACGSDNKVGDESLLNFKEQANNRLGETTTTTAAPTTTTAKAATATTKPGAKAGGVVTSTTAKPGTAATATTAKPAPVNVQTIREIFIQSDEAELALDPQIQTAYTGSVIRWTNKDKVARSVRADSGQFASPPIAPGASWDYTANTVGNFAYSDDTRPYVKGELRVAKKP